MSSHLILDDAYPEVLADIARQIYSSLMTDPRVKLSHPIASEVALAVTEHVRKNIGGVSMYIPRGRSYEASQQDKAIYRDFRGDNYHQLARRYNLTEMRVRQIINQVTESEKAKRQHNLFDPS